MNYLLVIKYGYAEFSQLCTHRAVKGWGRTEKLLGTHPFSTPIYVTWEQDPAAFYNPNLELPPLLPSWPRKAPGLESVLPLDLWLELPGCGVCRPHNQLQTKEDKGEPDGREEGEVKKGESPFLLQRKVRWTGGFGLTKYKPSHA